MPIPISQIVQDALSGSFIWEEYLGDFKKARQHAEDQLQQSSNDHDLAVARFSQGVVHLLRGQFRLARRCWDVAAGLNQFSESGILLLAAFRHLADYEQWNTKLDGTAAEAIEIQARWDVADVMQNRIPRLNNLRDNCTDLEAKNLAWFLGEIYGISKNTRTTAQHLQTAQFSDEALRMFAQVLQNMEQSGNVAIREGLRNYIVLPFWLRADIFRKSYQHEAAAAALDQAEKAARDLAHPARLALCILSRADWLSATFSNPLAWDFAIFDSSLENSNLAAQIEQIERPPVSPNQLDRAATCIWKPFNYLNKQQPSAERPILVCDLRISRCEPTIGRRPKH